MNYEKTLILLDFAQIGTIRLKKKKNKENVELNGISTPKKLILKDYP